MLLPVKQINDCNLRYAATAQQARDLEANPSSSPFEKSSSQQTISKTAPEGDIYGDKKNLEKRKENLQSNSVEPIDYAMERAIGKNDAVYSNFVELIMHAKTKIGRLNIMEGIQLGGYATGFMVTERLLLTNWHVFQTAASVDASFVEFDYELDVRGQQKPTRKFRLNPNEFFLSSQELDYCLVYVDEIDISGAHTLSDIGYIPLRRISGKLGDTGEERLNIIHHPNGEHKQLSIRENVFTKVMSQSIWYESDTAQGSSGSPVFNDQWQVVALHHMGVAKRDDEGNYLDKDNNIIEVINDKIDSSKVVWIANEGIRISVILKDLETKNDSIYIEDLLSNANSPNIINEDSEQNIQSHTIMSNQKDSKVSKFSSDAIHISLPPDALDRTGNINVNVTTDRVHFESKHHTPTKEVVAQDILDAEERRSRESTMNYDDCEGYQVDFLGAAHEVFIPGPLESYPGDIVMDEDEEFPYVLDYYLFSVLHDAERKMPAISAINIDGNEDLRKDTTKRRDNWIRDNRLDFDIQLDDEFYYKSKFDKGHLSRREDANWGANAQQAKRNADLTCVYTNAVPQVPKLNRSSQGGVWGKLETSVLENGAIDEDGNQGRISVFNGPIFTDEDEVFRGVKVPLHFFKVILWLTDDYELRATAFKLSQENLVSNIDFEQIDIDQEAAFKAFQISLPALQELTHLNFEDLFEFDTFSGLDEEEILSPREIRKHIRKAKKRN